MCSVLCLTCGTIAICNLKNIQNDSFDKILKVKLNYNFQKRLYRNVELSWLGAVATLQKCSANIRPSMAQLFLLLESFYSSKGSFLVSKVKIQNQNLFNRKILRNLANESSTSNYETFFFV